MKRITAILALGVLLSLNAHSQEVGVRFGDILGNNVALDLVFDGDYTRVHSNVSFGDGVGIEILYDFVYRPLAGESWNWYAGLGGFVFFGDSHLAGVCGELGLEYHFHSVPIAIGADWRPGFTLLEESDFNANRFGLNVRFVF